ncbi:nucleotidyltransferase domain-containing protein [Longispora sp. K20-0274]|uniref:nucleotidyltransferase domain-containing protein n=1 Tax=Longispora sp. K20-0274 TaxID=3088255 RepID=UPI00399B7569
MDHDRPEPVPAATALVRERFPAARWAIVTGSVLTPARTPYSDLDVYVVLPDGEPARYRESFRWQGWPVELFVNNAASIADFLARELAERRPVTATMVATGTPLLDGDGSFADIRAECERQLAAGPAPLTTAELDLWRYGVTDQLDDLAGSTDPDESAMIALHLVRDAAGLALAAAGHWQANGKWLYRGLRAADPDLAARLLGARDDKDQLSGVVREILDRVGGPLWTGFRIG